MRAVGVIGAILLTASAPLLVAQWREATAERRAYRRYSITSHGESATLNNRSLSMSATGVVVDGRSRFDRFGPEGTVLLVEDRRSGQRELIGIERSRDGRSYRRIDLRAEGAPVAQAFTVENADDLDVIAARFVTATQVSFINKSLQYWPGALYPVLYPWLTGALGAVLLLTAIGTSVRFAPRDA